LALIWYRALTWYFLRLSSPAHAVRGLESCRHAGKGLPCCPVTSSGSSGAANGRAGEEYQVRARYQIRANALLTAQGVTAASSGTHTHAKECGEAGGFRLTLHSPLSPLFLSLPPYAGGWRLASGKLRRLRQRERKKGEKRGEASTLAYRLRVTAQGVTAASSGTHTHASAGGRRLASRGLLVEGSTLQGVTTASSGTHTHAGAGSRLLAWRSLARPSAGYGSNRRGAAEILAGVSVTRKDGQVPFTC